MLTTHPLAQAPVVREIERTASVHLGRAWVASGFTDLNDRASHQCGLLHGDAFSVFAKLDASAEGHVQFGAELHGLNLLRQRAAVVTPAPVAAGVIDSSAGSLLLLEAVPEIPAEARSVNQWRSIGHALASLHQVHEERFGLEQFDGFFGPLRQDNRPVASNRWVDFYAERRLLPRLKSAVDSGHLPLELAAGVERLVTRLPALGGPETRPTLLHGDAQQNNFLTTATQAILLDAAPYFGHPEIDLALIDYFAPVPRVVFDAYAEVTPIDPGFRHRRELWRLFGYLAVITVDGASAFGRPFLDRIAQAVATYR
ncbi:fructosamine kinase family protein [Micromonospora foliorum]|uniref:fructosamine kinase family protein n=1 Tax=Micromonospora foliorum TaxID=2911210 RepID=UPI001EE9590C|nr:fructosamine kinase family protein [Micromonospora foliorum]MCG5434855.1 fructosamine kinase family protein [Micromonospora foliorum]